MFNKTVKILFIDNNQVNFQLAKRILSETENPSFILEHTDRLSIALNLLPKQENTNIIFLNLDLPDSQGLNTLTSIRKIAKKVPIIVLLNSDNELLYEKILKNGATDYLVNTKFDSNFLQRSIRYALNINSLENKLYDVESRLIGTIQQTKVKLKELENENNNSIRNYQHYLDISLGKGISEFTNLPIIDDETIQSLIPQYRDIIIQYVRSVRIREDRPSNLVQEFAEALSSKKIQAKDIVRIHLGVLREFAQRALPSEERAFSNDARLVLVELMGDIIDIYLKQNITLDSVLN
ncbi:MAG: response regulator [Spirochaetota bacterium]|nr:response regulator [Spirochaetota bacterium]